MNKFDFNIGATVHCKNGKFGKLKKLVVDPDSMEITGLVVGKGFFRTEDRIVPVSDVDRATDEYIMLSINDTKLEEYPEYVALLLSSNSPVESRSKSEQKTINSAYVAHPYVFGPAGHYSPVLQKKIVHANVHPDHEVIGRGTLVHNQKNRIGSIDHLLVDAESGELTHLVINQGLFSDSLVFPISIAERVNEAGIFLSIDEEEIDQLPEYAKRDDADIVTDLREQLKTETFLDEIQICVENGILRMDGTVPDVATKRRLGYVACTLNGVLEVENNLHPDNVADSQVLNALASDPRTEFSVIEAIEDRGIVTLSGQVDSVEILQAAIEITEAQPGVLSVINGLSVKEDPFSPAFVTHYTKTQLTP
jgi:osmotically-inducible protein OsmY